MGNKCWMWMNGTGFLHDCRVANSWIRGLAARVALSARRWLILRLAGRDGWIVNVADTHNGPRPLYPGRGLHLIDRDN